MLPEVEHFPHGVFMGEADDVMDGAAILRRQRLAALGFRRFNGMIFCRTDFKVLKTGLYGQFVGVGCFLLQKLRNNPLVDIFVVGINRNFQPR